MGLGVWRSRGPGSDVWGLGFGVWRPSRQARGVATSRTRCVGELCEANRSGRLSKVGMFRLTLAVLNSLILVPPPIIIPIKDC